MAKTQLPLSQSNRIGPLQDDEEDDDVTFELGDVVIVDDARFDDVIVDDDVVADDVIFDEIIHDDGFRQDGP